MQTSASLKIPAAAAIQMQTQLSNLIAIQNLQEYLKYLILTTSVEPQKTKAAEKATEQVTEQIVAKREENDMTVEEINDKSTLSPQNDRSFSSFSSMSALKRKKSQKLFSLMQKKYNHAKDSCEDEEATEIRKSIQEKANELPIFKKNAKPKQMVCGHTWREHYAKGLCGSCYLKYGRTKKPWNCSHDKLYALGLCQKCYAAKYNMKKKSVETAAGNQTNYELPTFNNIGLENKTTENLVVKIETA